MITAEAHYTVQCQEGTTQPAIRTEVSVKEMQPEQPQRAVR